MRGHLQRRGKNSWRLKFDLGRASVGERSTTYITLKGTKAQAQAQALSSHPPLPASSSTRARRRWPPLVSAGCATGLRRT